MIVRIRPLLAATVGLWAAQLAPLPAQEPGRFTIERGQALPTPARVSPNQKTADAIADLLRQNGQLHSYTIDIVFRQGVAELRGVVADQPQREEVLRLVQGVPGVERVIDQLRMSNGLTQVQNPPVPDTLGVPAPLPVPGPDIGSGTGSSGPAGSGTGTGSNGNLLPEPVPTAAPFVPPPFDMGTPRLPPYAWPTYAPYNNYSRVAYPLAYPYNAFPYIGPPYPFPKVPLGWRSVKLEWDDGYWWFSKVGCKHDWWRLRYW